jgi:hypothetical protein
VDHQPRVRPPQLPPRSSRNAFAFPTFDVTMKRYFSDIRDGDKVALDEEGRILPDIQAVQEEAARSLADIAKDAVRGSSRRHRAPHCN